MELNEEFVKEHNLSEDQVKAVQAFGQEFTENLIAETKKEYDGKANADAQAILDGASDAIVKNLGIDIQKENGEKIADFILRSTQAKNDTLSKELEKAKNDYLEKAKKANGSEELAKELEQYKQKNDELLKKYANFDELSEKAKQADELSEKLFSMKIMTAFSDVKPAFPDTVNSYEADAKWNEFKSNVLKDWNIEMVDGEAIAISKENKHKQQKLKEMVAKDENISDLLKGRQQKGPNGNPADLVTIEGVPFKVPNGATSAERSKLIRDYLTKEGISTTDASYASKFAELNKKIKEQQTA